jgi:c(7)-type cytochrome triheme protein
MRCANQGKRVGAFFIAFLVGTLYFYTQSGIEAQTTENPTALAPDQPQSETPSDTGSPLDQIQAQDEEEHPLAFDYLPKTKMGYVDWVAAIKQGVIHPRDSLDPNAVTMKALDFNVIFKVPVSGLPDVVYPHYPHTLWLDCRNCHPSIFLMRAGANPVTMAKILKGEYCGRCHGIVAFPISDCFRCHSRPK